MKKIRSVLSLFNGIGIAGIMIGSVKMWGSALLVSLGIIAGFITLLRSMG